MKVLFTVVFSLAVAACFAQGVFESRSVPPGLTGNWNDATSWTLVSGSDGDGIPDANDDVSILNTHTIFVNVTSACNALTLQGTGQLNFNTNTVTLTVNGTMTMNGNSTVAGGNANRTLSLLGNFIVPSGQIGSMGEVTLTQSAAASFTVLGEFRTITGNVGTKTIGQVFINSGGTNTGRWNSLVGESYTAQSLTIFDGPAGEALLDGTATATITVSGTFTVNATTPGHQSKLANISLTVNGTTVVNGFLIFTVSGAGTKTFNNTITVNPGATWDNIVGEDPNINCSIVNNGSWPAPTGGLCRYFVQTAGSYTYSGGSEINMGRLRIDNGTVTNLGRLTLVGDGGATVALRVNDNGSFVNGDGVANALLKITATGGTTIDRLGSGLGTINFSNANNTVEYAAAGSQTVFVASYSGNTYHNVTFSNSGTKTQGTGTLTVNGNFTLSDAVIYTAGTNSLTGPGNLIMNGTSELQLARTGVDLPELSGTSNSLGANTTITLNGTATQTLKSNTIFPYQNVRVSGGAGSAVSLANVENIAGTLTVTSAGAITAVAASGTTIAGLYSSNSSGATNISGGTGNLTVGSITLAGSGSFNYNNKIITINGNSGAWTNNGITTITNNSSSEVRFITGTNQTIGGTAATSFRRLAIDNTNNVTLTGVDATVQSVLLLTSGKLITGSQKVIPASVTRTSGFVEGNMQKAVVVGAGISRTFEVGNGSSYTPVTAVFASVSATGTGLLVSSTGGDHPDILSANIEPNFSVNNYWSMTNVGSIGFTTVDVTFTFTAGSVDAGFAPATEASVKGYTGTTWFNTITGTRTATTTQFTGLAASNLPNNARRDFQIGRRINTTGFFNRLTGSLNWHSSATWINNRSGNITVTNGSTTVTGSGTEFTTELSVGDQLVLQATPSATPFTIASITDDTNLELSAPYGATSTTGGFGRLRVPNASVDSVTIGNPVFNGGPGGPDVATTITLDANATINTLNINAPPTQWRNTSQTLTHSGTNALTVTANVVVNQPAGLSTTDFWNINAGSATVGGNLAIGSGNNNTTRVARVVLTTGQLSVSGNLIFNTSNNAGLEVSSRLNVDNGRVNLGGQLSFTNARGTLTMSSTGVFNFNRSAGSQVFDLPGSSVSAFVYSNVECNNTSANGLQVNRVIPAANLTGNLRVLTGTLQMTATGNPDPSISGNGANTLEVANGATLQMLGNNDQTFPSGFLTYTLGPSSTVIFAQTFDNTLPLNPTTFGNLTFNEDPNYTITNPTFTINGNLTIGNGTNNPNVLGSGTTTLIVKGNITINTSGTLNATNIPTILLDGNWTNNGTFTPGAGSNRVEFTGLTTSQPQVIGGTTAETFYNLVLNTDNDTDIVQLTKNITVSNVLTLTRGGLSLNANRLSVTNTSTAAIVRTAPGYILSETTASPYSRVRWTVNTSTGAFVFPFGKSGTAGDYIPFTLNITGAGAPSGTFELSTYPTAANNTPYPLGVTNMTGGGDNNGGQVVDRFWIITPSGFGTTSPTSTLTFTCTSAEAAGISGNLRAQRWNPSNYWDGALSGQTNPTSFQATVPGVTAYSPWTMASSLAPLPIELLDFAAEFANHQVELTWTTASEVNNDFFTVQRSQSGEEFTDLATIKGAGTSREQKFYQQLDSWPLPGVSYYRLRQTDFDGQQSYSDVRRVINEAEKLVEVFPNPVEGETMLFRVPENSPVRILLFDMQGRKVMETDVTGSEGSTVEIKHTLAPGLYSLVARTPLNVFRTKIVVR